MLLKTLYMWIISQNWLKAIFGTILSCRIVPLFLVIIDLASFKFSHKKVFSSYQGCIITSLSLKPE